MHLPTLSQRFAPDDGRVTDKQHDTRQDTQKAAGELQGRARWGQRERRREDKRRGSHGTHGKAARRHTAAGSRTSHGDTTGDTRQPRNTQQAGADGIRGGRQKKEYVIFKGDKERKKRR